MTTINLKNKPLVESILEIRWDLRAQGAGMPVDDLYDVMVGLLLSKLSDILPHHVRLPMAMVGVNMPYQVQHQYRKTLDGWPLMQLGPGILTVNETEGYEKENFLALCSRITSTLFDFWQHNGRSPALSHVAIRYIDADENSGPVLGFLKKLGVNVAFENRLFNADVFPDTAPIDFQLSSTFRSTQPVGVFGFSAGIGQKHGQPAVVWESQLAAGGPECAAFIENPGGWLKQANQACHDVFFAMINGELEERYK